MRILIAEDDLISARLLEATLVKWGYDVTVRTNGHDALEVLLTEDAPPMAVLDWMMPEMDGVQVCRAVRRRRREPYVYILLLTAKTQKEEIVEGMDAGADDYLAKPFNPHELRVRLRAGKRILELQSQLIGAREQLRDRATHDPLTGLWNHSEILEILHAELSRADRTHAPLTLFMLDIDHFKRVNDAHGHVTGDVVLRQVAAGMLTSVRDCDFLGRYGGEEFLVVLPNCTVANGMRAVERIREHVAADSVDTPGGAVPITVSIGVASSDTHGTHSRNRLLRADDDALYRAKDAGRNRTELAARDDGHDETPPRAPEIPVRPAAAD